MWHDPTSDMTSTQALVDEAIPMFEASGDVRGLGMAYASLSDILLSYAHWADSGKASQRGLAVAQGVDPVMERIHRQQVINAAMWGPTPTSEFIELINAELEIIRAERPRAVMLANRAMGSALAGDAAAARQDSADARSILMQVVGHEDAWLFPLGEVEYINGDLRAADDSLSQSIESLRRRGETGARSTLLGMRALVLFELDQPDDVIDAVLQECIETASLDDVVSQAIWREASALVAAREGSAAEAERLIGEADDWARSTDFPVMLGRIARDRGRIAEMRGDTAAAAVAYKAALGQFEMKGDLPDSKRMRDALARLS